MQIDFEPEVQFPEHPYEAAIVFLGVTAYPERGAGQIGNPGSEFASSLASYLHWQARKHKGLARVRIEADDPNYTPPHWAQFRGRMNRGLKRIRRRAACYSLHGTRMVNGFFSLQLLCEKAVQQGKAHEVYDYSDDGRIGIAKPEVWQKAIRSARGTLARDVDRWARSFGLNHTGTSADSDQKAKDLERRAVRESLPVLHLAHALDEACREIGPTISGWGQREPTLALLMNSEKWIDKAINTAERWRCSSHHPMVPDLSPERMVKLTRNLDVNAP